MKPENPPAVGTGKVRSRSRKRWARRLAPLQLAYHSVKNYAALRVSSNAVSAYWYPENNFGDQLTPYLLRYCGLKPLFMPQPVYSDVICVGSILEHVPESYNGIILGSGFLFPGTHKIFKRARILAVRGRFTAEKLSLSANVALGDPGLLVGKVFEQEVAEQEKRFVLGIVPHYRDIGSAPIERLAARYPRELRIIDVCQPPLQVMLEIAACQSILSSSLHGVIAAHSLDIPAAPIHILGHLLGGEFKFHDYFSAIGSAPDFTKISGDEDLTRLCALARPADTEKIQSVQAAIEGVFAHLAEQIRN